MSADFIIEISIDEQGRLLIYPEKNTYPMIYREGVEVHWDSKGGYLFSPKPREWTYLDWFKHIISTVKDLQLSPVTRWSNFPENLKADVIKWMNETK